MGLVAAAAVIAPSSTETAVANGDTRTLHLYHTHTFETIDATFRVDGRYDPTVLRQLNHFLRDWRNNDETNMDPRLFDAVWEAYRSAGATDRIQIYSAYRSPETNAMLRRRSHAVAEHSQHMLGKAMDTTMPDFPMSRIREAGMKLERGGVGWYPSANFVHLDVGGVRSWPRMPYEQLARLFPDGKTVHIPSNGKPMPGYEEARAELAQRGGDVADLPPSQESGGFFAWLFGGGNGGGTAREDEEDRRTAVAATPEPARQQQVASVEPAPQPSTAPGQEPSAQPLDERVRVESRQGADTDAGDRPVPLGGVLPLPPRRPADLVVADAPEIPLPPVRPDRLSPVQTASIRFSDARPSKPDDRIAGLISASGIPVLRKATLPAIITQGTADRRQMPAQALAFVSPDAGAPDLVPMPVARPVDMAHPLGLRSLARRSRKQPTSVVAMAAAPTPPADEVAPIAEARLTGLRRAAQLMAMKAAL